MPGAVVGSRWQRWVDRQVRGGQEQGDTGEGAEEVDDSVGGCSRPPAITYSSSSMLAPAAVTGKERHSGATVVSGHWNTPLRLADSHAALPRRPLPPAACGGAIAAPAIDMGTTSAAGLSGASPPSPPPLLSCFSASGDSLAHR